MLGQTAGAARGRASPLSTARRKRPRATALDVSGFAPRPPWRQIPRTLPDSPGTHSRCGGWGGRSFCARCRQFRSPGRTPSGDHPVSGSQGRDAERVGARLLDNCRDLGVSARAVLVPITAALSERRGEPPVERAGLQHGISSECFARVSALRLAIAHDGGALGHRFRQADVILTGVPRTSKTPRCIYLAYRRLGAANVPVLLQARGRTDA